MTISEVQPGGPAVHVAAPGEGQPIGDWPPAPGTPARLLSPSDFPLWLVAAEVAAGTALDWGPGHGEEIVYVASGSLSTSASTCPEGGAVVLEAGAPLHLVADEASLVLHFGSRTAAGATSGRVHVVGPGGTWALVADGRDSHYYADSTCTGCAVTLLYTSRSDAYESVIHSHSADEIIHLLAGRIEVGRWTLTPGSTLTVRHDASYRFHGGDEGFAFINFRAGPSTMRIPTRDEILVEGGEVNGFVPVMDLR